MLLSKNEVNWLLHKLMSVCIQVADIGTDELACLCGGTWVCCLSNPGAFVWRVVALGVGLYAPSAA